MKSFLTILSLLGCMNIALGQENQDVSLSLDKTNLSTAIVGVAGMACQEGCADKISDNLNKADGVVSAVVSYDKKEAIITFDSEIIPLEKVKNIITNTKVKDYAYSINKITVKE